MLWGVHKYCFFDFDGFTKLGTLVPSKLPTFFPGNFLENKLNYSQTFLDISVTSIMINPIFPRQNYSTELMENSNKTWKNNKGKVNFRHHSSLDVTSRTQKTHPKQLKSFLCHCFPICSDLMVRLVIIESEINGGWGDSERCQVRG